jgi:hypothetical protein
MGSTNLSVIDSGNSTPDFSEFSVQVLWSGGGVATEFNKKVTSQSSSEQTFKYIYLGAEDDLLVTALARTTCGSATVSGGTMAFERVE